MAIVVNTNMANETTQRLLDEVSRSQMRSMERLTTGLRVNSAKDDASGFSVVNQMNSQLQGLSIATNNANDGINMLQMGDSALSDSTELLQRMRELSVQSMNATYTSVQRSDMDVEFQQLNSEINRMASVTKFNNIQLLKGTSQKIKTGWEIGTDNALYMSGFALTGVGASIKTAANASAAVAVISGRMQAIQTQRAKWGAMVNRVENAIASMDRLGLAVSSSRSRFQDTDYAKESANLARTQVSQQAGMAMMAQSNQSAQNVLSLLR